MKSVGTKVGTKVLVSVANWDWWACWYKRKVNYKSECFKCKYLPGRL